MPGRADNIANVNARHDFLIDGINRPRSVAKAVHSTLLGQRAFAALELELPDTKIKPIALNTLKSLANELFIDPDEEGHRGFAYLDALRVKLLQKLSDVATTRTVKAKEQREANKAAKSDALDTATAAMSLKIQKAYSSLYSAFNGLIKSGELDLNAKERVYRILKNHHAAFSDIFEPDIGNATSNESKVTKLRQQEGAK